MKKLYFTTATIIIALCATLFLSNTENPSATTPSAQQNKAPRQSKKTGKILVAYFTCPESDGIDAASGASRIIVNGKLYGNTEHVARTIADAVGGELFAIQTVKTYPAAHQMLIDDAKREAEANARPALATHIDRPDNYDIIFVGYPNWWYDMPMPLYTFFDEYDFSGKTIIPFCTHGGSRFSQSVKTIAELEKDARVIQGSAISRDNVAETQTIITNWLQKQNF